MMALEYPTVLGSPVAGLVESIGPGVSKVAVGQRVVCGTKIFTHKKPRYGGLQRFAVVDESEVLQVSCVPSIWTYTEPTVQDWRCGIHQSGDGWVLHASWSIVLNVRSQLTLA